MWMQVWVDARSAYVMDILSGEIRTVTLHDGEELDDDLRGRTDKDLALAAALRVDNVVLRILVSNKFKKHIIMNIPSSRSLRDTEEGQY